MSEVEASLDSFHDCHVHGLHWRRDAFTFAVHLQYIVSWIKPDETFSGYRFWISEAILTFRDVDDLNVSMTWTNSKLDAQIDSALIADSRSTPSGLVQRSYEIDFSDPEASISIWSSGYSLELLQAPVVCKTTSLLQSGP